MICPAANVETPRRCVFTVDIPDSLVQPSDDFPRSYTVALAQPLDPHRFSLYASNVVLLHNIDDIPFWNTVSVWHHWSVASSWS